MSTVINRLGARSKTTALQKRIGACVLSAFVVLFTGCAQNDQLTSQSADSVQTVWASMPASARSAHARAVQIALETRQATPVLWSDTNTSGEIAVEGTSALDAPLVCRRFRDRVDSEGQPVERRQTACWTDYGWVYATPGLAIPILQPAWADDARLYTAERRTSLSRIARRTGSDLSTLRKLNPSLKSQVKKGAQVLLP